jgi:(2Fe-2S) ferredoxin
MVEEVTMVKIKHHIFVCTSCRITGQQKGLCYSKDSVDIVKQFMEAIEDADLSGEVMITNTGCFGICEKGPIAVIYPEGIWYGNLTTEDIDKIVEEHIINGIPVEELMI